MRNQKSNTRRTLTLSIMAICLCCVMLVGATFAWFTDTATSGVNKIQSGNLDLNVEYTLNGTDWQALTKDTQLFEGGLFEPGYTRVVAFRVKNAGNLALKYAVNMNLVSETKGTNVYDKPFKLSDYLTVNTIADATAAQLTAAFVNRTDDTLAWTTTDFNAALESLNIKDVVLKADETGKTGKVLLMQVTMPTDVGNEANAKDANSQPAINFGVAFVATQAVEEADSYGNTYDEKATYPVASASELQDAFANGGVLNVTEDIVPDKTLVVNGKEVTLNAAGQTVSNVGANDLWNETNYDWSLVSAQNGANLTITDGEFLAKENDCFAVDVQDGSTVTIKNGTYVGNVHAVYVYEGTLIVEGGTFSVQQKYSDATKADEFVLNCYDANRANGTAKIIVKGGTFIDFNPADCQAEGAHTNFVAPGYKVISEAKDGHTYYTVVAE